MKRSMIGAGVLALALGLSACGGASPSTPASGSAGDTTSGAATSATSTSGDSATSATSTSGDSATSATSTSGDSATSATSTSGDSATSATSTSGDSATSATSTTAGGDTVVDAAIADPRFSTLVSLLEATGLSAQLAQAGPFTIFAPTNEAFAQLPAGTLEALAQNPSLLQSILLYHVADGELMASDVATATSAPTKEGSEIEISAQGDSVTLNGTAQVIETDISVGNGVIHVIDQVLLPPNVTLPAAG